MVVGGRDCFNPSTLTSRTFPTRRLDTSCTRDGVVKRGVSAAARLLPPDARDDTRDAVRRARGGLVASGDTDVTSKSCMHRPLAPLRVRRPPPSRSTVPPPSPRPPTRRAPPPRPPEPFFFLPLPMAVARALSRGVMAGCGRLRRRRRIFCRALDVDFI